MSGLNFVTDGIVNDVLKVFLGKYGKELDSRLATKIVGKTAPEAAIAIVEDYQLPLSTDEFISEITPMFSNQ